MDNQVWTIKIIRRKMCPNTAVVVHQKSMYTHNCISSLVSLGRILSISSLSIHILVRRAISQREQSMLGTELGLEVRESMCFFLLAATAITSAHVRTSTLTGALHKIISTQTHHKSSPCSYEERWVGGGAYCHAHVARTPAITARYSLLYNECGRL